MEFIIPILAIAGLLLSIKFTNSAIARFGTSKSVSQYRVKYISKTINLVLIAFYTTLTITFLGLEYTQITIFLSSIFAVLGVALFAQWSILSNITASLIIFFGFPYRVGDKIRILDKDSEIVGEIEEIALFHVLINTSQGLATYPNNLILQKAVIKNPTNS
ncbi:mechanosensitive ion channel domain-containing protein [uncultured Pseudoteredinibacter sp.]|uniref:mechanosensitive ion channel domain-containing protein n=1 Tax=uncultured Pseudoteredinibacter sp. TaxID=1641701 RepID=UPI002630E0FE|nr:mechanosensitive ion channel domain-containing protein [uncultured Pseudoteredinibacter sp.]